MSRIVFISAPYETGSTLNASVAEAIAWADLIRDKGYLPICPHLFHFWDFYYAGVHSRHYWMSMCLEWVSKAEVVFRVNKPSKGGDEEVAYAQKLGIPVVTTIKELQEMFDGE